MPYNPVNRYTGRGNGPTKNEFSDTERLTYDRPPTYHSTHYGQENSRYSRAAPTYTSGFYGKEDDASSKAHPKNWSRLCWIVFAAAITVIVIITVIVAVVVENRYPDYSKLNYNLVDTYSGTSFFDSFNYFTGYDPAQGFVQYVCRSIDTGLMLTSPFQLR